MNRLTRRPAIIPLLILIPMFIAATSNMPYGYYILLRVVTCASFAILFAVSLEFARKFNLWACGIFTVIYNPLIPIRFDKDTWQVVNLITVVLLIILITVIPWRESILVKKG